MTLPLTGLVTLPLGVLFGFAFGWLIYRGHVADANVIVNQFRLRDYTVIKVLLTAIIVGGVGVLLLHQGGLAAYHIKPANLLGVGLGAAVFGVGMAIGGYCPGTSLAALGGGSLHALATVVGMIGGAVLFALSFDWIKANILPVGARGPLRLPEMSGVPDLIWFAGLAVATLALFVAIERRS